MAWEGWYGAMTKLVGVQDNASIAAGPEMCCGVREIYVDGVAGTAYINGQAVSGVEVRAFDLVIGRGARIWDPGVRCLYDLRLGGVDLCAGTTIAW